MDLKKLAEEMQQVAKRNVFNQDRGFIAPEVCHRVIELDGIGVNVMLTFNEWDSMPCKTWQLSLSKTDYRGLVPEDQAQQIVTALLGTENVTELTQMMPKNARPDIIRQFMRQI